MRRFLHERRSLAPAAILVVIAAVFVAGAIASYRSVGDLLDESATETARQWADTFLVHEAPLDTVLTGQALNEADKAFFEKIAHVGHVFRYKIFDRNGTLLLISDQLDQPAEPTLTDHRPAIAEKVLAGETHTDVFTNQSKPGRPTDYAEAYVPIRQSGRVTGVVEVYVDQTLKRALFGAEIRRSILITLALAVLAMLHTIFTAVVLHRKNRSDAALRHLAYHDPLTGLANRKRFQDEMAAMEGADGQLPDRLAILYVDLDCLKAVNDTLGHHAGDQLLRQAAAQIVECTHNMDTVARLGGDEFAIIVRDASTPPRASALARKILQSIRAIKEIDGTRTDVTTSIGIAFAPEHSRQVDDLLKFADVALYEAKMSGRDRFVVFKRGMDEHVRNRSIMRAAVRDAISTEGFTLFYQPLHSASTGLLNGFEALIRLPDNKGGFINPADFIPLSEEMGVAPQIGQWVLKQAMCDATTWPGHLSVAINLSAQHFEADVVEDMRVALAHSGLDPRRVELEITESLFLDSTEAVQNKLLELKALGVRIVMDDFGTGYSSLSHLWRFPFDKVKVDRSCIQELGERPHVQAVLRTVTAMGQAMQLGVTAEGIETETQRAFAVAAGYDNLQGFFYSPPMPGEAVGGYLDTQAAQPQPLHPHEAGALDGVTLDGAELRSADALDRGDDDDVALSA